MASRVDVVTEAVAAAGGRLRTVPSGLAVNAEIVSGTPGAASDTAAAGAYDSLVGAMGRLNSEYAEYGDALAAVIAAAECYQLADRLE